MDVNRAALITYQCYGNEDPEEDFARWVLLPLPTLMIAHTFLEHRGRGTINSDPHGIGQLKTVSI